MDKDIAVQQIPQIFPGNNQDAGLRDDVEAGRASYPDIERIEKVYRKLDWRIIPGMIHLLVESRTAIPTEYSILGPLLSLLSHSIQCRFSTNNEHETAS